MLFVPVCFVSVTIFSDDQGTVFGFDAYEFSEVVIGALDWVDENWFADTEWNHEKNMRECGKVLCD